MLARLQATGVSCLGIETDDEIGGNWMKRYDSVTLHTSKSMNELPFDRMFNANSYFLTGKDYAQGLKNFARQHHLQVWLSSSVQKTTYDSQNGHWTVQVLKDEVQQTVRAKHLSMALGGGVDKPNISDISNRDEFKGSAMHSSQWKNAHGLQGKHGGVFGTGSSAFDIAKDMVRAGCANVTVIQRGQCRKLYRR